MSQLTFQEEAEDCRRTALVYIGRPEAKMLLSAAKAFDDLAAGKILPKLTSQAAASTLSKLPDVARSA